MLDASLLAWFTRVQGGDPKFMRDVRRWFDEVPSNFMDMPEELRQRHVRLNVLFMQRMHDDSGDGA